MDKIIEIYCREFNVILTEELHPELKSMLETNDNQSKHYRFSNLVKKVRELIKTGTPTGLTDDKPKKGSSRAVMFHSEPTKVKIDGIETEMPTVSKIAFSGRLDKFLPSDHELLGEAQNNHEHEVSRMHGVLEKIGDNEYRTRSGHPFMTPVLDGHENGSWLHVAKIKPLDAETMKEATKTDEFPKGITQKELVESLNHHFAVAHGEKHYSSMNSDRLDKLIEHPLVESAFNMCLDTSTLPSDFSSRNLGVWEHPISKRKYIVASDAGFSREVSKAYQKARNAEHKKFRGW